MGVFSLFCKDVVLVYCYFYSFSFKDFKQLLAIRVSNYDNVQHKNGFHYK